MKYGNIPDTIFSVLLAVVLVSCSDAQDTETRYLMIEEFLEEPESFNGQPATFQGFLDPRLGSLAIYKDKENARLARGPTRCGSGYIKEQDATP